jgi:hypothetical protein
MYDSPEERLQSSLYCSVKHMSYRHFVHDLYGILHRDFDRMLSTMK